jgi:hypothetical protein
MFMNKEDEMEVGFSMALIIIFCSIDKVVEKLHCSVSEAEKNYLIP